VSAWTLAAVIFLVLAAVHVPLENHLARALTACRAEGLA
jgi:hypothetical protein